MKVLIVDGIKTKSSMVNLGLGFLVQYIRKHYPVTVIALAYNDTQKVVSMAKNFDVIGCSCITEQYKDCLSVANEVKTRFPEKPIVFGGVHPTATYKKIIYRPEIDYICIGEAEISFLKLLQCLDGQLDLSAVPGIVYLDSDGHIQEKSPVFIDNLDEIGMPAWDILERDESYGTRNILTARGCPYNCTYCYNSTMRKISRFTYRRRSVESVIEECKLLKKESIQYIAFSDDLFLTDKEWIEKFANLYGDSVAIPFGCSSRPEMILSSVGSLRNLKSVGLTDVWIGIESGNARIRKEILNRKMSNEVIVKAFQRIRNLGLKSKTYNIVGIPTEGLREVWDTFKINLIIRPDKTSYYTLMPYPGTKIWDIADQMKLFAKEPEKEGFFDDKSNVQGEAVPVPGFLHTGPLHRYHIVGFRYLWYLIFYSSRWYRIDVHMKYLSNFFYWFSKGFLSHR